MQPDIKAKETASVLFMSGKVSLHFGKLHEASSNTVWLSWRQAKEKGYTWREKRKEKRKAAGWLVMPPTWTLWPLHWVYARLATKQDMEAQDRQNVIDHKLNIDEKVKLVLRKETESFTRRVSFSSVVRSQTSKWTPQQSHRPPHIQPRGRSTRPTFRKCRLSFDKSHSPISTYIFSQSFWYSICDMVMGRKSRTQIQIFRPTSKFNGQISSQTSWRHLSIKPAQRLQ